MANISIPDNLPAGISIAILDGKARYRVRTSRKGKRYNLGTFLTAEAATAALVKFQYGLVSNPASEIASMKASSQKAELEQYRQALDATAACLLSSTEDAVIADPETGDVIIVPAELVAVYLEEYNQRIINESYDATFEEDQL
jgi:hypothetical protein